MSDATAGLVALLIVAVVATLLIVLGRMNETGHGSRVKDLREILEQWRSARTSGERALIFFWYLRALFRVGYYAATISVVGALTVAAAQIFGGPAWELVRQMLCDVLRFLETLIKGKATSCEPVNAGTTTP